MTFQNLSEGFQGPSKTYLILTLVLGAGYSDYATLDLAYKYRAPMRTGSRGLKPKWREALGMWEASKRVNKRADT